MKMTGRLVAAARALAGVSRKEFASAAGLSVSQLARIEAKGSAWLAADAGVRLKLFGYCLLLRGARRNLVDHRGPALSLPFSSAMSLGTSR